MSLRGYSYRLVQANRAANSKHIGVKLGRHCIAKDMTVVEIAKYFKVSRMTIYQWFSGNAMPHKANISKIEQLLNK